MADDWTFQTLIAWIEAKLETVHAILQERQEAVNLAFANFKSWMASTNEWRGAQDDLLKTRVSQEAFDALAARVKRIEDGEIKSGSKGAAFSQLGAIVASAIVTASAVVAIFAAVGEIG